MSKIDTKNRKEFRVGELFDIHPTKAYKLTNAKLLDWWDYPVVVNSAFNNWIWWYTTNEPTEKGNTITFSDTVDANTIFYQEKDFVWYAHVQGLYPYWDFKNKWNKWSLQFFCSCFRKSAFTYGFDYWNKFRRDIAIELSVLLPVDNEWNPDREYMENYMKNLEDKCKTKLQNLILARGGVVRLINTNLWKEFKVWDLFEISSPSPRSQNNYEDWEVPFVASWDVNNWILKYCNPKSGENLDSWNCITVSPVDWSSFYQNDNFLGRWWAGSSIMILRNENLNKYRWLFIAWIIRKCCNFTYNDMWNREKLKNLIVKFPVDSEWNPNRDFMENYIKNLIEKNREKLKCLN